MAKKTGTHRTTITVPLDLKRRMGKVKEQVNWSALACRAFEQKLAEIAARKREKSMEDIVTRLRESRRGLEESEYRGGFDDGTAWAENTAEAGELRNLDAFYQRIKNEPVTDWQWFFDQTGSGTDAYGTAEKLAFILNPEEDGNRYASQEFWEGALGELDQQDPRLGSGEYLRGFCEGALDLWWKVEEQL